MRIGTALSGLLFAGMLASASYAKAGIYTFTDLGALGGDFSVASAINNAGQVVGRSSTATGSPFFPIHATLWDGSTTTDLGTLGGWDSRATAINNAGQVAGNIGSRATLWNGTTMTDLGALGGLESYADAINDTGQVVGGFSIDREHFHAALWNGTTMTDLGTLGGSISHAYAINNAGQVVGYALNTNGGIRATLWGDTMKTDLNSLLDASTVSEGWVLRVANGINDNGWIIGDAYNSQTGVEHGFLLARSVPEPKTYIMMLTGLGLLGVITRRRKQASA